VTATSTRQHPVRIGFPLRTPRAAGILAAAIIVVALTYLPAALVPTESRSGNPAPADHPTIAAPGAAPGALAALSVEQLDRSIEAWSANLAAEPRDFLSATNLATLYHGRGQLTGDLGDHERALEAATTALGIAPTYAPARAVQAAIRFTLHDFAGAFAVADSLYLDDTSQLGALAIRADAAIELGRIDQARRDLDVLAAAVGSPAVDIRLARLASVTGEVGEALRLAKAARAQARQDAQSGVIDLVFYERAVGEYARLAGDARTARAGFVGALAIRSNDLGALLGLARIDAFEGRTAHAVAGLEAAAAIAPQPETLALLGDLRATSGDQAGAEEAHDTVRFIAELSSIQQAVYDRLLIRFDLDHGAASATSLEAARESAASRPDAAGHDLLAWALYRLGHFDEAAIEIQAARALGADDVRLAYHEGAIRRALGDERGARELLESALALGPALDPVERAEALRLLTR
jgi:tetratricopeptide (TPR) repeat protein